MLNQIIKVLGGAGLRTVLLAGAGVAGLAGAPALVEARHPDFHVDVVVPAPSVFVEPIGHAQRRWVDPVYQTVTEQVWIPAVTQAQTQRVVVPAGYEWQDTIRRDFFGRPVHYRQQVYVPAHDEDRTIDVVVCAGHYELQTHEQLVCAGHWVDEAAVELVHPGVHFGFPLPF